MKRRVNITIDEKLLADVDKIRGLVPRSRFLEKFLEKHLNFQIAKELLNNSGEDELEETQDNNDS